MTYYRAYTETPRFVFEGFSATEKGARAACLRAWRNHARLTDVDRRYVDASDIQVMPFEFDIPYRDREALHLCD